MQAVGTSLARRAVLQAKTDDPDHQCPPWQVDDGCGWQAVPARSEAQVRGGKRQPELPETAVDHPRMRLVLPRHLPAGWYWLEGVLQAVDGDFLLPCLFPRYAGSGIEAQVLLPDPDARGRLACLVLLHSEVVSLDFSPGLCPPVFSMRGFRLRRIGRGSALRHMLMDESDEGVRIPATMHRAVGFVLDSARYGVSRATDRLFSSYDERVRPRQVSDYTVWTRRFDTFEQPALQALHTQGAMLAERGPLVSVIVPTWNTPEEWLRRCIGGLREQAYPRWELCVADDASTDPRVMEVLEEHARADSRIRVTRRASNGHIAAASNTALAMAQGDYVALLDHDDELRPHALLEMAEAIVRQPDLGLVYSDEDKLDVEGRRFDPYFKPDWNPDLLRSQNYVCHLTVIRTSLAREVGGFREGFEGSQDHDLILRCIERLAPAQIHHVPKVLYHWRAIEGSTALSRESKDYASSAGARAVAEHLERIGSGAQVEELSHGHFRVRWPVPKPQPKVSLIVPTRDRVELLRTCVESILDTSTYRNVEVVVVDNQSSDPATLAYLKELETRDRVHVLRYDAAFNYSAINNWAAARCDGEVIGLVNNDIEVITPDWLEEMVGHVVRPDVGAVGAMLYYPDDTIQHAGVVLGVYGVAGHIYAGMPRGYHGHGARAWVAQELSAVTGACMLVRRSVFEEVGGLDERLQVAFNDIDFCLRLREHGYRNIWTPFAELYHHESASRGSEDTDEKKDRFANEVRFMLDRWGGVLADDPAYNPNLSLQSLNFELAFPPRKRWKVGGDVLENGVQD